MRRCLGCGHEICVGRDCGHAEEQERNGAVTSPRAPGLDKGATENLSARHGWPVFRRKLALVMRTGDKWLTSG